MFLAPASPVPGAGHVAPTGVLARPPSAAHNAAMRASLTIHLFAMAPLRLRAPTSCSSYTP